MHQRPVTGDIVIWDVEPNQAPVLYWVRRQGRGSATQLFDGPEAWDRAYAAAAQLAGPGGVIWKRHKDGHFEQVAKS